jgi:light-regulated signal transduction histidine kinase (bacteriophytochrome)
MERLLNDLRIYTQVSAADDEPLADIDAGRVLETALASLAIPIKESGASISTSRLPRVRMYEVQLEQLFQNLIANAIRYRGEAPPCIQIAGVSREHDCLFSVADNGIGIGREFHDQIFGLFKRLHTAAEYPGTGMGLAICRRIVERVGGRIWVESEPGKGSTFYFTVPCESEAAEPQMHTDGHR